MIILLKTSLDIVVYRALSSG